MPPGRKKAHHPQQPCRRLKWEASLTQPMTPDQAARACNAFHVSGSHSALHGTDEPQPRMAPFAGRPHLCDRTRALFCATKSSGVSLGISLPSRDAPRVDAGRLRAALWLGVAAEATRLRFSAISFCILSLPSRSFVVSLASVVISSIEMFSRSFSAVKELRATTPVVSVPDGLLPPDGGHRPALLGALLSISP